MKKLRTNTVRVTLFILIFLLAGQFAPQRANAQAEPEINIMEPKNLEFFFVGRDVVLKYEIGNFTFTNPGSTNPSPNAGYAVVWADTPDEDQTRENGKLLTSSGFVNLGQFDRGMHEITMELFRPDGSFMEPRVRKSVKFTVGVLGQQGVFDEKEYEVQAWVISILTVLALAVGVYIFRKRSKRSGGIEDNNQEGNG